MDSNDVDTAGHGEPGGKAVRMCCCTNSGSAAWGLEPYADGEQAPGVALDWASAWVPVSADTPLVRCIVVEVARGVQVEWDVPVAENAVAVVADAAEAAEVVGAAKVA